MIFVNVTIANQFHYLTTVDGSLVPLGDLRLEAHGIQANEATQVLKYVSTLSYPTH